jgi:hypothetical protein
MERFGARSEPSTTGAEAARRQGVEEEDMEGKG